MNLRLFALRDLATGRLVPEQFFSSKPAAKLKRDEYGADKYSVTYGPDHRKYRG